MATLTPRKSYWRSHPIRFFSGCLLYLAALYAALQWVCLNWAEIKFLVGPEWLERIDRTTYGNTTLASCLIAFALSPLFYGIFHHEWAFFFAQWLTFQPVAILFVTAGRLMEPKTFPDLFSPNTQRVSFFARFGKWIGKAIIIVLLWSIGSMAFMVLGSLLLAWGLYANS
jgi:hypothetical protein